MQKTGYLSSEDFSADLEFEIGHVTNRYGRLLVAEGEPRPTIWAQNVWFDPVILHIDSIKDAASQLRAIQRNWALYAFHLHRRAQLIQDSLPHVSAKPIPFMAPLPTATLGSWTLIDENHILVSPSCSSPFRNGEIDFIEDRDGPPSRAYLKLWEFFTLKGLHPDEHALCLDLGSCPGGWTWVLANLGCRVISVDKAPLAANVRALPNVSFRAESAFGLDPLKHEPVDWLFSDVICYPERLLNLVKRWMEAGKAKNYVCTIKFQGATDHNAISAFSAIPGSELRHLFHNKHELMWSKLDVES